MHAVALACCARACLCSANPPPPSQRCGWGFDDTQGFAATHIGPLSKPCLSFRSPRVCPGFGSRVVLEKKKRMADGQAKERGGKPKSCIWQITVVTHACKCKLKGHFALLPPLSWCRTMWLLGDGHWAGDSVLKHHTQHADSGGLFPSPSDSDIPDAAHCTAAMLD